MNKKADAIEIASTFFFTGFPSGCRASSSAGASSKASTFKLRPQMPSPDADLAALMQAAARAAAAGDDAQAEPLLRRIVAMNARDAEAWHMLAVIAVRAGRAEDAVDFASARWSWIGATSSI